MTTDISGGIADRQRSRAARATKGAAGPGSVTPPRQRRPALAALALLLIVGGALVAGLLAVRMDTRVPVLVAARDIEAGAEITEDDLRTVPVASDELDLIGEEHADVVIGAYAATTIRENTALDERMVTEDPPIGEDRAVVSVPLTPKVTPADRVRAGDVVQVWRASGEADGRVEQIAEAYVLSISQPEAEEFATDQVPSAVLLVPTAAAGAIINAASADLAGLAILASGQDPDVPLDVVEAE